MYNMHNWMGLYFFLCPHRFQDTEMQVVIVGAGRADLVAQTKVGPGRR